MQAMIRVVFAVAVLALSAFAAAAQTALSLPAAGQSTLDLVKQRGQLACGVNGSLPGFSLFNAVKQWEGLDVELCRAVAAAVLGDANKVNFVSVSSERRFAALAAGEFDLLARNSTGTLERTAGTKVRFVVPNFYDGQAFVVPKKLAIDRATSLRGGMVCALKGTTHLFNMESWFGVRRLTVLPQPFDSEEAMYGAFFASRCMAVTEDSTALAAVLVRSGKAADYMMLPDIISKEPLGPYVRAGDDAWFEIVRWTHYAMLEAEEYDIRADNVDDKRLGKEPLVRRLLGVEPGNGRALGLDEAWAYNIIKQVGNYSESYERNVGAGSALKFGRGINALWSKGGLMYALPLR
jgi:general L-amino acid transport system substrate-binding protein